MQYAILIYETKSALDARNDPQQAGPYWGAWGAYAKALAESGVQTGGAGLQGPDAATTLRRKDGKSRVQDGPYADTKEQLGGFFLVDVADLDKALEWARRVPARDGDVVEVRPLLPPMG